MIPTQIAQVADILAGITSLNIAGKGFRFSLTREDGGLVIEGKVPDVLISALVGSLATVGQQVVSDS